MQCLAVCLQYEPTNPEFLEKEAFVKAQQNAKNPMQAAAASAVDVDSPEGGAGKEEDLSPKPRASISEKGKEEDKDQKAPRSCQLFGFSWF
jgi:hypothetical protein